MNEKYIEEQEQNESWRVEMVCTLLTPYDEHRMIRMVGRGSQWKACAEQTRDQVEGWCEVALDSRGMTVKVARALVQMQVPEM